jgi:hypothetical protein
MILPRDGLDAAPHWTAGIGSREDGCMATAIRGGSLSLRNQPAESDMKTFAIAILVTGLLTLNATAGSVAIQREPPEGAMRLGQRIRVDDGTCPTGKVKEVTAAQLTSQGIQRTRVCVKR